MNWYTQEKPQTPLPALILNTKIDDPSFYKPGPGLKAAVDVALTLGQPLLLTGEPGVGKSQLAYHLAWFIDQGKPAVVPVQTTSVARDLFYRYDALGHFQYNQNHSTPLSAEELEARFITYQGIGEAIRTQKRMVVLIDEIDKAPRDLPNDVLTALDRMVFEVPEIRKSYSSDKSQLPIVVITSNSEKNLPDPFLRRVVYYHIPFPSDAELMGILKNKINRLDDGAIEAMLQFFNRLRSDEPRLRKKPSTSELLLWADLLARMSFNASGLADPKNLNPQDKENLRKSISVLVKTQEDLEAVYKYIQ